jgi:TetR/AcrR family tetracycline transcriptional repressor
MASAAAQRGEPRKGRRGLRRGSLTPELIVKESLKLLDAKGTEGFSLPKLGRALGADPTAVYRHFPSKDNLVLAIADQLIEDAMAGLTPHACWVDTVTDIVRRLRRTYCDHPAAAWLSACRTTQRPAEMRVVDTLIGAVLEAGFEGATAARVYRAIGDFALSWAGWEAAFLALDIPAQETDRAAWARAYRSVGRAGHPHIWQLREELPDVTDDDVFETVLSLVVAGLLEIAPHRCSCHPQQRPTRSR